MIEKTDYKHLEYISKSKKGLFESCPFAFKISYIDKRPQEANPYFIIGTDVHDFIDNFFDVVEAMENGDLKNISKLKFHPNLSYKKNVVKFEIGRWKDLQAQGFDATYFNPVAKEKKYITESPKLIGIVDRIHKCCREDVFAPKHEDFKDGDLVIVENKTGKPTPKKCKKYEEDMLWYKILAEIVLPELAPIKWGAIYFPYNNYVYHTVLTNKDCRALAKAIRKVRKNIMACVNTNMWPATPSPQSCRWCNFKSFCPHMVVK
ncbi:MAG: PD-(D/E)XK nuclease family protein [Nanoarchaeota archaeon]|nr:PD-(D/E)XK nuclease family protein [Nanoarchaeota archaeon]